MMKKTIAFAAMTACLASPIQAADWQGTTDIRHGGFVGARLRLPLGSHAVARPQVGLTLAPTLSRRSGNGLTTNMGEGVTLNLAGRKPELTFGGVRADRVLSLARRGSDARGPKQGLSTGAWIAVGAGATVLVGAAIFVARMNCVGRDKEFCGSD